MIEERRSGSSPPHAAIIAAVAVAVLVLPTLIGDQCDAVTDSVAELLSPLGLLLLPITLLLAIQFLSSDPRIFSSGDPNSAHRLGGSAGSTTGVVVFLLLVLLLLYSKVSIFSGDDDDSV